MDNRLKRPLGTVQPALEFDVAVQATTLNKAVLGLGTDEDAIIDVLSTHSNKQRMEIKNEYENLFGQKLANDLKDDLSGDFKKVVLDLLKEPAQYDSEWLHSAMSGPGTNEALLLEILSTRTNQQIRDIRKYYNERYGKELADDLKEETSGSFKKLLVTLCNCMRDESGIIDKEQVKTDTEELLAAGCLKFGTDDAKFNRIFCVRGFDHLREVFAMYKELSGVDLEDSISLETGTDYEKGLLALTQIVRCTPEYFATLLHGSMSGLGTNDASLRRLVVSRCEVDMINIRDEFEIKYEKTLEEFIRGDTSGDYRKLLLRLIGIRSAK